MSTVTGYPHIEQRADGKVWIIGTQTKVLEVALDRLAHHWDADEIQRQHPHLTLGQIYGCLAYYYDHQQEMDRIIEEQLRTVERLRMSAEDSVIAPKVSVEKRKPARTSLGDWAETNGEHWGKRIDSEDVDGFTGRRL
jgi:uncharacterized protein (DUF433 family)